MARIWRNEVDIKKLNEWGNKTMAEAIGIEFIGFGDDYLEARMPVDHRTKQPAGLLHGGASVALAETLGSVASYLCVKSADKRCVGIEINANHLKASTSGFVIGRCTPIRIGGTMHVWSIEIKNEKGELTCVSRLTVMVIAGAPA